MPDGLGGGKPLSHHAAPAGDEVGDDGPAGRLAPALVAAVQREAVVQRDVAGRQLQQYAAGIDLRRLVGGEEAADVAEPATQRVNVADQPPAVTAVDDPHAAAPPRLGLEREAHAERAGRFQVSRVAVVLVQRDVATAAATLEQEGVLQQSHVVAAQQSRDRCA
jgi:hypothetical protein